jgi:hypothetical protein
MRSTQQEIQDEICKTEEAVHSGVSAVPAMSYEEGVNNALRWALGETNDKPMENA